MTTSTLLALVALAAAPAADPGRRPPEDLLRGPARAALRFLDAVREAGPRVDARGRAAAPVEADYRRAQGLLAARTRDELRDAVARGEEPPLAFWREAARGRVLESFQLLAVRRGPRGTAIVLVEERTWRAEAPDAPPARTVSEYLVARDGDAWRVAARRPGGTFDEEAAGAVAAKFDAPLRHGRRP